MKTSVRLLGASCIVGACALALSSCSSSPTVSYGGGNGGGSSAATTTTAVVPTIGAKQSPTYVAAKFVEANWSTDPTWPNANYAYVLDRPNLTRSMIADDAQIASRPQPASVKARWALDAKQMGGALWAESAGPGLGATFVLELPLLQSQERNAA